MFFINFKKLIQWLIFIFVLFYLYIKVDYTVLINLISFKKNIFLNIFIFLIVSIISNILLTFRWKILIEGFKQKSNFLIYFKSITDSVLLSEISFLGIFSRILIKYDLNIRGRDVVLTLFIEKLLSLYVLIFLSFLGLSGLSKQNIIQIGAINQLYYFFITLIIFLPFSLIHIKKLKLFKKILNLKLIQSFYLFLNYKHLSQLIVYTLLIQSIGLIKVYLVTKIFNLDINFLFFFSILPIIKLFIAIPATITPWGWREFIYINILPLIGFSSEQSLIISITNSTLILIIQFILYIILKLFSKPSQN